jgi:hypothetical protein
MNSDALSLLEPETPLSRVGNARDVAGACKQIVLATAMNIQGRKYVRVEGWQAIAIAHGCIASARDVEHIEGGIRATAEVRRISDGVVLCTAEGFVGDDESMWAKRPLYARRAMAQTRAISRACRSAFAHVVVMMDAGLETTPAEEVPDHDERPAPSRREPTQPELSGNGSVAPSEQETRDVLLGRLKAAADVRKLNAKQRAAFWERYCRGAGADNVDLAALQDCYDAVAGGEAVPAG